jgi:hypothetical protein
VHIESVIAIADIGIQLSEKVALQFKNLTATQQPIHNLLFA